MFGGTQRFCPAHGTCTRPSVCTLTTCADHVGPAVGVIAIANVPDKSGRIYTSDELRAMADGARFIWNESRGELAFRGVVPEPPGVDIDAVHFNPRWTTK